jgi:chaperonin GroES
MATKTKDEEKSSSEKDSSKEEKGSSAKGFQPLGDRIFVTYTEELERTAGGIYVPDVEILKVGDQVLFDKYSGTKIKIENEDCLILKEEDVLGIFV